MKKTIFTLFLVFVLFSAFSQITITTDNIFLLNDDVTYYKVFDVVWDFSEQTESGATEFFEYLDPTGKPHVDIMPSIDLAERLDGNDNGFFYFDNADGTEWNRSGAYVNDGAGTEMWWAYEISSAPAPLQLMMYPFTYNDEFSVNPFGGSGGYDMAGLQDELQIPNLGQYHFECDGWGMLILPHKVYPNALRVHVIEEFTINLMMAGTPVVSSDIEDDAYYWYVEGVQGHVMSYVDSETIAGKSKDVAYNAKWYRADLTEIQVDLMATETTGDTDDIFDFINLSEPLNDGSTFLWEFSPITVEFMNTTTSASVHPDVRFTEAGDYSVTLTVTNSNFTPNSATITKTDYISVDAAPELIVDFEATPRTPDTDEPVNFTTTVSDDDGTTYEWNVSPGSAGNQFDYTNFTSNEDKDPEITFYQAGCYSIQLVVTNDSYSNSPVTVQKMSYINVDGGCGDAYDVTFLVTDGTNPIQDATVDIVAYDNDETDADGFVTFSLYNGDYDYTVNKSGYGQATGEFTIADDNHAQIDVVLIVGKIAEEVESYKIYPNPTTGIVYFEGIENANISIYSITGKMIINSNSQSLSESGIDLSNQPKGIYFIRIEKLDRVSTQKIILQ